MKKVILCILDGVGISNKITGNAVKLAYTPNLDYLLHIYPSSRLKASGLDVGLPQGQMGNSEVGHMTIGSGRKINQELVKINEDIKSKNFFKNKNLLKVITDAKNKNKNIHVLGLLSDGGIHSHIDHLLAIIKTCQQQNFKNLFIHVVIDGRDTEPLVGKKYTEKLENCLKETGVGKVVSIMGRFYAMNRDANFQLTEQAYETIVNSKGIKIKNIEAAFKKTYQEDLTDEFMKPMVLNQQPITNGDSLIMYNFRADRMIQIMHAINDDVYDKFKRNRKIKLANLLTMTEYEDIDYDNLLLIYEKELIENTLGEVVSKNGLRQKRITEFEKKAHVTFFFNGCSDVVFEKEDRKIFDRPNVVTYDEQPEMRSYEITEEIIKSTQEGYDLIVANYPNGDAVGHSGDLKATISAMEALDKNLGRLIQEIDFSKYTLLITADHGNAEHMVDEVTRGPDKMHTTNKVYFIMTETKQALYDGTLADIAPTILEILEIDQPQEMTGKSLIRR